MADLIAIVALALQYSAIILLTGAARRAALPLDADVIAFLILAGIGLTLWHHKRLPQTSRQWITLSFYSIVLGLAFFGWDVVVALLLDGQANPFRVSTGALGLPLTLLVCPGGTIICLAGAARTDYLRRSENTSARK